MSRVLIIALMLLVTACQTVPLAPTAMPTDTVPAVEWVTFDFGNVQIRLHKQAGWDVYQTDYHLIMTEGNDPFRNEGRLHGILVHMWMPTSGNLQISGDIADETVASILEKVVNTPDYVGVAVYHHPVAFDWGGHDAAYYTLANSNGNISLVIAFKVENKHFIAVNISAPSGHEQRIRELLPIIFDAFYINDELMDASALDKLPSPLVFPIPESVSATRPQSAISPTD